MRVSTASAASGSTSSLPFQARCTIGFTFVPLKSGDVSTWAMNPIAGTPNVDGLDEMVAVTYPRSSSVTGCAPMARSSAGLVTASRSIVNAYKDRGGSPANAAEAAAEELRETAWAL